MKNIFLKLFTILLLVTSCSESEDETDNPTGADCSSFLIDVANWTNNYNARVQISGGTSPYTKLWSNGETTGTIGGTEGTLEVGTYTVMVTDAKGCVLNGSIIIEHQAAVIENSVECIGSDVAVIRVDVTDNGESEITEKGICYSLTSNPTIDDTTTVFSNIYSHTIDMEPLSLGTTYFVRGYAINSAGVNYGEELSFTTNTSPPVLSIGQYYQGGIIAGISCDGLHGYVVGSSDYGGTWNTANDFCENLVSNGYDDWYLQKFRPRKFVDTFRKS